MSTRHNRRVALISGSGKVLLRTEPTPELKPGQILIKVHASLISPGTEVMVMRMRRHSPDETVEPLVFGYSNAGEVLAVSPGCNRFKVGQRVVAMGGGYAMHTDFACVPVNLAVPLPDNVSYHDAVYCCLAATALQSVYRTEPQLGEYGAVLGLGIVGNLAAQFYQLTGCRVIAWEGMDSRIQIANACGLENIVNIHKSDTVAATKEFASPYGLDFANIAFGGDATEPLQQVVQCMKVSADTHQMGRIVLVGGAKVTFSGGASMGNLDIRAASRTGPGYKDDAYEHGRDYPNAFVQFTTQRNMREIVRMMAEQRLHVAPLTTHRAPLDQVSEMMELLLTSPEKAVGVVLTMQ